VGHNVPVATTHYDAIVLGAGQSGGPLSSALARSGRKTAIVEREHVGGTCINEGCTPTKTMVASARVAYLARRAADYGVHTGPISIDMARVRQRKRDIVDSFRGGSEKRIRETEGLDLIFGEAHFVAPKTIAVDGRELSADLFFINTGCRPARPEVEGIDQVPVLNSTTVMELDEVPEHLVVLGGGYVGLEFGQMFRRFGARVTIVQRGKRLLAREDGDVADEVARVLREDGIEVLSSTATRVGPGIRVTVEGPEGERELTCSHLLEAAGRVPNTDMLQASATGLKLDERGFIPVDPRLRTNVEGVYALGDVHGGPAFTHISYDDWRIIRTNLLEGGNASTTDRQVPYTVFIDPQLGRIGVGEDEARAAGQRIRVAKMPMSSVARALEIDESRGFMKIVVDAETDQILGAAILGIEGGEIMAQIQIAMLGRLRYQVLQEGIFAHPTLAESLNNVFGSLS
jgi:pyruvate/2-oxoglutarate dehydrogenase complex dihydrolipoamide dehydrogenase (E3) component